MEKHCTTVYFLLKKTRKDKNGDSPIDAWIAVNGERTSYSTGKKVKVSEWDEKKQLVKGSSDKAKLINEYLYQLRNKVFQKEIELMEKGFMLTPTLLKEAVNDHVDAVNQKTLIQVFNDFQAMRKPLIGKKIAKDTYEDNDLTGRYIKEFMEKQYHRSDIYLHEVKIGFAQGFHTFLLTEKNNRQNSCSKHLKFLKQLMNIAVAMVMYSSILLIYIRWSVNLLKLTSSITTNYRRLLTLRLLSSDSREPETLFFLDVLQVLHT